MSDKKYNGWTNYATWRVNLEMFDAWDVSELLGYSQEETIKADAFYVGQVLQEYAEERICEDASSDSFALSYALAFISDVNWTEIASSMIETYKDEVANA